MTGHEGRIVFRTVWSPNPLDGKASLAEMRSAFQRALSASPDEERWATLRMGGDPVTVHLVGRNLGNAICEPFAHLHAASEEDAPMRLAIELWDEAVTAVPFPGETDRGPLRARANDGEWTFTLGSPNDRFVCHRREHLITWFDRERGDLVGWVRDARRLSPYDLGKPLFLPLLLWQADRGRVVVHAALVSRRGAGVLLVGNEGSGKTTAALSCVRAGFDYLGDDYVTLAVADGIPIGHSLYNTAWGARDRLTALVGAEASRAYEARGTAKAALPLSLAFPDRLTPAARIASLAVIGRATGQESRALPISRSEALLALGPSSLLRLPIARTTHLEAIAQLLEAVPTFRLETGRDPGSIAEAVDDMLRTMRSP